MDKQPEQCRLFAVIKEVLWETWAVSSSLRFFLEALDEPETNHFRAQVLIIELQKALQTVQSSQLCTIRTGVATHPNCHCELIQPTSVEVPTRQAACNGKQLIARIQDQRSSFQAFADACQRDKVLPPDQAVQLTLMLITLIFKDASTTALPVTQHSLSMLQVRNDFQQAFHGTALELLQHYIRQANAFINANNNTQVVYAKTVPILQSSGTGKTKLAVQLSAYQAGMLVCTRRDNSLPTSFPPFDKPVFRYFSQTSQLGSSSESGLTTQHRRLAAWLGAYFRILATYIERLQVHSQCFRHDGTCRHEDVERCWRTVVYQLARDIHRGTDFIDDYKFEDDGQTLAQLCSASKLLSRAIAGAGAAEAGAAADHAGSDPDTSLESGSSLLSSQPSDDSTHISSEEVTRFRTRLLQKVTKMAEDMVGADSEPLPLEEAGEVEFMDNEVGAESNDNAMRDTSNQAASCTAVPKNGDKNNKPAEIAEKAAREFIRPQLAALENLLPQALKKEGRSFFFLAVDEVAEFKQLLPILRRLWRESQPACTWLILIDTESSIAHLAGDGVVEASLRLGDEEGKVIVPPFTFLPFDVHFAHQLEHTDVARQLRGGTLTFGHLVNMLRWFGRPLWSTGHYSCPLSSDATNNMLERPHLDNILKKLFYGRLDSTKFWPAATDIGFFDIIMAAAGQRLPLTFVGHQLARLPSSAQTGPSSGLDDQGEAMRSNLRNCRDFLQRQVSKYLRIVSDVNRTDSYITATPSEPAVSLAVASQYRGSTPDALRDCGARWSDSIQILAKAHRSTGLMLGEEGEECARLLATMAADVVAAGRVSKVAASEGKAGEDGLALFHAQCDPIRLRDWLKLLLNVKEIQLGDPRTSLDDLLKWASDFYLNFTHFVKLGITVVPYQAEPALLVEYWCRQAAICGITTQNDWDFLIPIYRAGPVTPHFSDAFKPSQLSYVAIQVKNRTTSVTATDRFGPSFFHAESANQSADGDAAAATFSDQDLWPRPLDDCLEIFFDLRGVSGICLRHFTETRPLHVPEKNKGTHDSSGEKLSSAFEGLSESRTEDTAGFSQTHDPAEPRLRPTNCYNLVVSGTSAKYLPVITHLDDHARKDLNLMFAFDDDNMQQNWKTLTKLCTSGGPIIREFEVVAQVLHGVGRNHLLELGPGKHKLPRRKTTIPGRGFKREKPDDSASHSSVAPHESSAKRSRRRKEEAPDRTRMPSLSGEVSTISTCGEGQNGETEAAQVRRQLLKVLPVDYRTRTTEVQSASGSEKVDETSEARSK